MRLFKPGLHVAATSAALAGAASGGGNGDFPLTPELLLPESFGDIFLGEMFRWVRRPVRCVLCDVCDVLCPVCLVRLALTAPSLYPPCPCPCSAYVSVVNGAAALAGQGVSVAGQGPPAAATVAPAHNCMYQVSMLLHLMGRSATTELKDERPGAEQDPLGALSTAVVSASLGAAPPTLAPGQRMDTVVRAMLGELGSHTLRVTIQYWQAHNPAAPPAAGPGAAGASRSAPPAGEMKTMRKFYKFNVLAPLCISTAVRAFAGDSGLAVQAYITNLTNSPVFLESAAFISAAAASSSSGGSSGAECIWQLQEGGQGRLPRGKSNAQATAGSAAEAIGADACKARDTEAAETRILAPQEAFAVCFALSRTAGRSAGSSDGGAYAPALASPATSAAAPQSGGSGSGGGGGGESTVLGHVEATWCVNMGERGVFQSAYVHTPGAAAPAGSLAPSAASGTTSNPGSARKLHGLTIPSLTAFYKDFPALHVQMARCPAEVKVGVPFSTVVRVSCADGNARAVDLPLVLDASALISDESTCRGGRLVSIGTSVVALSVLAGTSAQEVDLQLVALQEGVCHLRVLVSTVPQLPGRLGLDAADPSGGRDVQRPPAGEVLWEVSHVVGTVLASRACAPPAVQ